jgi:hypothetical protein
MRLSWLAGLGLLICGCGLADYEKQMANSQARVERIEEERKFLDEPIFVPRKFEKEASYPLVNLFFRPPKGINPAAPANEKEPHGGILYWYPPRKPGSAGGVTRVELAIGGAQKEFGAEVLKYFTTSPPAARQRQVRPPGRAQVNFETFEFEEATNFYSVNLWRQVNQQGAIVKQLAIVYQVDRTRRNTVTNQAIEMSLQSLAVDAEANAQRDLHKKGSPLDKVPDTPPS